MRVFRIPCARRAPVLGAALLAAVLAAPGAASAADIARQSTGKFPIATSAVLPPGTTMTLLSGMGADPIKPGDTARTLAAYGDTETQVRSALNKIKATLEGMHLSMGDVVQMHVYLVADPKLGHMDFAGMMKAYTEFFGPSAQPAQPNLPTRSAFQVAGLANPGWLVEIEVTAAKAS